MKIVFIGAGNLATHLSKAMRRQGFEILQIYSRTAEAAKQLASLVQADWTTSLNEIREDADLYIFSVKDSVLETLIASMPHRKGLWVHTAGSIPMDIFASYANRFGVFYPLQTFSKNKEVDFKKIPFFIEANHAADCQLLCEKASLLSDQVIEADSDQRKHLHLAAVFACNFTNHMYVLAARLVEEKGLPFDALKPLITETAAKIGDLHPMQAQTGPAIRYDQEIMAKHIALLEDTSLQEIYRMLSENIHNTHKK